MCELGGRSHEMQHRTQGWGGEVGKRVGEFGEMEQEFGGETTGRGRLGKIQEDGGGFTRGESVYFYLV